MNKVNTKCRPISNKISFRFRSALSALYVLYWVIKEAIYRVRVSECVCALHRWIIHAHLQAVRLFLNSLI